MKCTRYLLLLAALPIADGYRLPSGKRCGNQNMFGSPYAPTMFSPVVVRMPTSDENGGESDISIDKMFTDEQLTWLSYMAPSSTLPATTTPSTTPRPLEVPLNTTARLGISISYLDTNTGYYKWLTWGQLVSTHGRKLHVVLIDESLKWYHHIHPSPDTADDATVFYVDVVSPAMTAFTVALDFVVEGNAIDLCIDEASVHVHGAMNDPDAVLAAVSLSIEQLMTVPAVSVDGTSAVVVPPPPSSPAPPIANVGAVLRHTQALPTAVVDEIDAMIDVTKQPSDAACIAAKSTSTTSDGVSLHEERCVSVQLRVWERVKVPALPSADWAWLSESSLAYIDLYEWNEVLAAGAPVSTMVMKPQHCYYVEASVYDHRSDDSGAVPAVKDLRPYLQAASHVMVVQANTSADGSSPINPFHTHAMAASGGVSGPPMAMTPLSSRNDRETVKRCEMNVYGDGMIMADDDTAEPAADMGGMVGMMPPSAFGPSVGAMVSIGEEGTYGMFWSFGRGDALITTSFNFQVNACGATRVGCTCVNALMSCQSDTTAAPTASTTATPTAVPDTDGDGVPDAVDTDIDGDGIKNDVDADIDGDGIANDADKFPNDATETADADGDGVGDNAEETIRDNAAETKDAESKKEKKKKSSSIIGGVVGLVVCVLVALFIYSRSGDSQDEHAYDQMPDDSYAEAQV